MVLSLSRLNLNKFQAKCTYRVGKKLNPITNTHILIRMNHTHIKSAPKRPVNLTVDANLLKEAKELDIQLSSEFENLLERLVAEKKRKIWQNEVRDSIEVYSTYIEKNGTFSDGLREF